MRKKILMFVYGDITTDARVQRAVKALSFDNDVILLSNESGKPLPDLPCNCVLLGNGNYNMSNYFRIVYDVLRIVKREKPDIFYGHDYYSALLIRLLVKRKHCKRIVYDAHELYVPQKGHPLSLRSRFFYTIEKSIVKKVDLLICASYKRAEKMKEHYRLKDIPIAIRNISQLTINQDSATLAILKSLEPFFKQPGITVVYAGVVTQLRRVDELASAVALHPDRYKLLIVGDGDSLDCVKNIANNNTELISAFTGKVPYNSLGAILSRCDIGFIYYPIDTLNNIYCASNKLYEYASVNLPILANENPTIKDELDNSGMGIGTDDFLEGLQVLSANLNQYRLRCSLFTESNQWSNEEKKLQQCISKLSE